MKSQKHIIYCLVVLSGAILSGCEVEEFEMRELKPVITEFYDYQLGEGNELPTLGRVLFYDSRLSINNTVSCASCHQQKLAFADNNKFSLGFEGKKTLRNSMPIQNIVGNTFTGFLIDSLGIGNATALFWDGRQHTLETMVMEPIQNHIEMGTTDLEQLADKLQQFEYYTNFFFKAFGDSRVTPDRIARALGAFLISIRANQSRFDNFLAGNGGLFDQELTGKVLFFETYDCNSCHQLQEPVNGYQLAGTGAFGGFADIGLDSQPADPGVFAFTGNPDDKGKFKIPSLRNIALTAPYMHDGRLETLEEVIDHYSENILNSPNLDERLKENGTAKKFNIPAADKLAIIAFLRSMTDHNMINDPKFSNPFRLN